MSMVARVARAMTSPMDRIPVHMCRSMILSLRLRGRRPMTSSISGSTPHRTANVPKVSLASRGAPGSSMLEETERGGRARPSPTRRSSGMTTKVHKTVEVDVPVTTVYNQWTQFEEFPHFMGGVEKVTQLTDASLEWEAQIAGVKRKWKARIVEQVPDTRVGWAATEGDEHRVPGPDDPDLPVTHLDSPPASPACRSGCSRCSRWRVADLEHRAHRRRLRPRRELAHRRAVRRRLLQDRHRRRHPPPRLVRRLPGARHARGAPRRAGFHAADY
ncbi:SRPBCC family protein [Georgenia sp. SUBG003]|uniref:SRPBCC family protein n=1 Tax=Georgenia sp. SUBG003 TaxID=1497974 RepID=UPI003AB4EA78